MTVLINNDVEPSVNPVSLGIQFNLDMSLISTAAPPSETASISYEMDQSHNVYFDDSGTLVKCVHQVAQVGSTDTPVSKAVTLRAKPGPQMLSVDIVATVVSPDGTFKHSICTVGIQ